MGLSVLITSIYLEVSTVHSLLVAGSIARVSKVQLRHEYSIALLYVTSTMSRGLDKHSYY